MTINILGGLIYHLKLKSLDLKAESFRGCIKCPPCLNHFAVALWVVYLAFLLWRAHILVLLLNLNHQPQILVFIHIISSALYPPFTYTYPFFFHTPFLLFTILHSSPSYPIPFSSHQLPTPGLLLPLLDTKNPPF